MNLGFSAEEITLIIHHYFYAAIVIIFSHGLRAYKKKWAKSLGDLAQISAICSVSLLII